MWPTIRDGLKAFLLDPAVFKKTVRVTTMALAGGGLAYADKIAAVLGPGSEKAVHYVKIASLVCMGLTLAFGGGDSTLDTLSKHPEKARAALGIVDPDGPAKE